MFLTLTTRRPKRTAPWPLLYPSSSLPSRSPRWNGDLWNWIQMLFEHCYPYIPSQLVTRRTETCLTMFLILSGMDSISKALHPLLSNFCLLLKFYRLRCDVQMFFRNNATTDGFSVDFHFSRKKKELSARDQHLELEDFWTKEIDAFYRPFAVDSVIGSIITVSFTIFAFLESHWRILVKGKGWGTEKCIDYWWYLKWPYLRVCPNGYSSWLASTDSPSGFILSKVQAKRYEPMRRCNGLFWGTGLIWRARYWYV